MIETQNQTIPHEFDHFRAQEWMEHANLLSRTIIFHEFLNYSNFIMTIYSATVFPFVLYRKSGNVFKRVVTWEPVPVTRGVSAWE